MAELTGMTNAVREIVDVTTAKSIAALHRSIAVRALQPARYGGLALRDDEFVSLVCELGARDASLGWLTAMFNAAAFEVAGLPEHTADEVWNADPNALVATSYRAEGGIARDRRLTGRWESVVGAEYADWLLLSAGNGGACRVLVPRSEVRVDPVTGLTGLSAAGSCDVTVSELIVDERHVFRNHRDHVAVIAGAGMAAAVVGSADGVWRKHVDQVRARLATSYGGEQVTDEASAEVARAASDIDAAKLQVTTSCELPGDLAAATCAFQQAVARSRDSADRLLGSSRHALDASDPVTSQWKDVHAGCRLAVQLLDGLGFRGSTP
jgi:3-hydroxy-9,10-secoandrosta-1,3,5(10)-triene-9,17-dione monooxygenase